MGWSGRAPGPCQHVGWAQAPNEKEQVMTEILKSAIAAIGIEIVFSP